jgi:signal transduction histidine kinase
MHGEIVLAALVLVVAVLVAADFFRRTDDGPHEYAEGQAHDAGPEIVLGPRAGSVPSVSSLPRPNWLVRTRLGLLAVVSAAAAALATGGVIRAVGAFRRASAYSHVGSMHDGALVSAIVALVFAVAVLAVGLYSAMILIRSVLRPLDQLRTGALELSAPDEIGDVARAFDQARGEALRLSGSEARLRGQLSEMFAELSGRGQLLMDHQLRLIDEFGQDEHDAGRRASLVTMNRLAVRMRRHSENLLVLAGQELPGLWNRPVLLANVIGAAVAQTGQRERVSVSAQPEIAISGPAVNDVVHLVAELAENAASLSATDTPVAISGRTLATSGVLVEVTDQGIGMNPETMATANWRLEHPPPVDAAVSRNMGLFVVGRLAARHGIRVRLQPAANGGLTALVWLPDPIIVPPEPDVAAGFVPAEPETQAHRATSVGRPRAAWRLRALAPSQLSEPQLSEPQPSEAVGAVSSPESSPAEDPADGRRLPIYDAVESDWFSRRGQPFGGAAAAGSGWVTRGGGGWDAAKTVLAPVSSGVTTAGLPVRAPRANLVPGAFGRPWPDASGPVRSADAARNRLAGFQQGASRGRAASGHDGQDPAS